MGTEMKMQEWKDRNHEAAAILEKHRPVKEYWDEASRAAAPMETAVRKGKHRCIACEQPVKYFFFANHRLCEQCLAARNTVEDYRTAFQRISLWMSDFYIVSGTYPPELIRNEMNLCWKAPVRIGKSKIKCKTFMRRDVLEVNMIYAYVQLWLREKKEKDKKKEKDNWKTWKKKNKWKRRSIQKIPYWYMAQYLYYLEETELAEIMRRRWERSKRKAEFYFEKRDTFDDREQYTKMLKGHPLSEHEAP